MIRYIEKGDIFRIEGVSSYAHGRNCADAMDKGIAVQFKDKYLDMYIEYKQLRREDKFCPGDVFDYNYDNGHIYNLGTQATWRTRAKTEYIAKALIKMLEFANRDNVTAIALPATGAGLDGLKWSDVKAILEKVSNDYPNADLCTVETYQSELRQITSGLTTHEKVGLPSNVINKKPSMRMHDSETNKRKKKLMLEPKEFEQGIEYALANDCDGLQVDIWNIVDIIMDFRLLEKVANQIVFLPFMNANTTNVSSFEYIYFLGRLKTFYCQKVDLYTDFARPSSLRNIGIFYNKNFLNLDKLEQLESAVINKFVGKGMLLFSGWKFIKTLHIHQSQIECLQGVEDLVRIDTLVLEHNRKLTDIGCISLLDYAREVSLEKNSRLHGYSMLANDRNIHNLFISDLDDLEFIKSMKSLPSFKFWNCKNGDLSPLLANPILKEVYFTPNKKHYSYILEQIKILITSE